MTPPDERWWVLRAQAGDTDALTLLLNAVHQPLGRYVGRLVRNRAAADDVLQEVMLTIYRKIQWLERPEAFRAWTYRIASRQALKELRGEERRRAHLAMDTDVETLEVPFRAPDAFADRLPELLSLVSPSSRVVLALHYLEDLPLDAIAAILDIPIGTVKSRLAQGLKVLRLKLDTRGAIR